MHVWEDLTIGRIREDLTMCKKTAFRCLTVASGMWRTVNTCVWDVRMHDGFFCFSGCSSRLMYVVCVLQMPREVIFEQNSGPTSCAWRLGKCNFQKLPCAGFDLEDAKAKSPVVCTCSPTPKSLQADLFAWE